MSIQTKVKQLEKLFEWKAEGIDAGTMRIIKDQHDNEWRPMFRGYNGVSSPRMEATHDQKWKIFFRLKEIGFKDPMGLSFKIDNRANRKIKYFTIDTLDKGTAWDILQAIKKGRIKDIII